ncbi:MAG: queuosine precursor transporter [Planctomycetota bacterium]
MPNDAALVPSQQHAYPGRRCLSEQALHIRRERVFLVFAGLFLGTLAMLNILGISRFIRLGELTLGENGGDPLTLTFAVAVGVLPYPLTFLCTDFISELYGRKRANFVVLVGLVLNLWVIGILWLGGVLPGFEAVAGDGSLAVDAAGREPVFFEIRALAFGAVTASMIAYLAAQLVDVQMFHFWKWLTKGKHLWLRNNGSTIVSQLVDTTAVILITYQITRFEGILDPEGSVAFQLFVLIATGYAFKLVAAMLDTVPFVLGTPILARYLRLPPSSGEPNKKTRVRSDGPSA